VAESTRLVDLVQERIDAHLAARSPQLHSITPELDPFIDFSRDLLAGGKRFRALFCYWGWQSVSANEISFDIEDREVSHPDLPSVVLAAAALEVFHAAALVHDDIMDNSDTRRGIPAAHKRFERLHHGGNWTGESSSFGRSAALLLGDLLLAWSDELFGDGLALLGDRTSAELARAEFNLMRTEVTVGQYLDILEESAWLSAAEGELFDRANRVILYKSAKYSVEAPLAIGAALAGASDPQLAALRDFGLPLGVAFQLRDDILGVFGDPAVTGKPAGDDLREGKRTLLVALARRNLPAGVRTTVDELLGDRNLNDQQINALQNAIRDSGAIGEVEVIIADKTREAIAAIADAPLSRAARKELVELADTVMRRTA
jgi:geranylgeranyl diphosphate synthase, type I